MIIIPARLKSTRFAEKILCDIKGLPMFVATAKRVSEVDTVCVAVDDEKVLDIAHKYGLKAVMTSSTHESGTDRINEACEILALKDSQIIINVQADEPLQVLALTKMLLWQVALKKATPKPAMMRIWLRL